MASKYETSATLDQFYGIDQSRGWHNVNLSYAVEAENCDTAQGILRPAAGYAPYGPALPAPVVTLCSFYRRAHPVESERHVLVAATATALYALIQGATAWIPLGSGFASGRWSWVTYETVRNEATCDVLILSNAQDGVVVVYGDDLTLAAQASLPKFGMLARHAERIWGTGIDGEPDNLYYSQPYNPLEWGIATYTDESGVVTQLPEQSGGMIQVPTWDGDHFTALRRLGNFLIAVKQNSLWYVRGLSASEFGVYEAYGSDGALAAQTVAVDNASAYYLSDRGLGVYDGDSAHLLDNDRLRGVFSQLGDAYASLACAVVHRHILHLALPVCVDTQTSVVNGVSVTDFVQPARNNMLVEYDLRRNTYMLRTGFAADALYGHAGRLLFSGGDNPYQVYEISGTSYNGASIPVRWMSAWQDMGGKNVTKSAFRVRITGFTSDRPQKLRVSIQTERKLKTREIEAGGRREKQRLNINNRGRRWRLILEADSSAEWVLDGGIQIDMELDED